jgi:hypothetical protein
MTLYEQGFLHGYGKEAAGPMNPVQARSALANRNRQASNLGPKLTFGLDNPFFSFLDDGNMPVEQNAAGGYVPSAPLGLGAMAADMGGQMLEQSGRVAPWIAHAHQLAAVNPTAWAPWAYAAPPLLAAELGTTAVRGLGQAVKASWNPYAGADLDAASAAAKWNKTLEDENGQLMNSDSWVDRVQGYAQQTGHNLMDNAPWGSAAATDSLDGSGTSVVGSAAKGAAAGAWDMLNPQAIQGLANLGGAFWTKDQQPAAAD